MTFEEHGLGMYYKISNPGWNLLAVQSQARRSRERLLLWPSRMQHCNRRMQLLVCTSLQLMLKTVPTKLNFQFYLHELSNLGQTHVVLLGVDIN